MLPLGLVGGFHLRMIWEDELEEEMGSRGTEGSEEDEGRKRGVSRLRNFFVKFLFENNQGLYKLINTCM